MEQTYWWEQVGPRRFYIEVVRTLKSASVVVWFPQHATEDILVPLDEGLNDLPDEIRHVDASEEETPENLVRRELPSTDEGLFKMLSDAKTVLIVRKTRSGSWLGWKKLLEDYHRYLATHRLKIGDVSRFLVIAEAPESEQGPSYTVALKYIYYKGYVTISDTERYCQQLLAGTSRSTIERLLSASIIANVALWDKGIAARLCGKSVADILDPIDILRRLALERKWKPEQACAWHNGIENNVDGERCSNSAWLALHGESSEIKQRIWRAQLKVLFPFIEQQRNMFIDLIRRDLPFVSSEADLGDMEFLRLRHLIKDHLPKGAEDAYDVFLQIPDAFGDVRNCLAHREPAPADKLQAMFGALESLTGLWKYGFSATRARISLASVHAGQHQ